MTRWIVEVERRCSLEQLGIPTMQQAHLEHDIVSGRKICPVDGETLKVVVESPADNIVRQAAVEKKSGSCPLCGLKPKQEDFKKII